MKLPNLELKSILYIGPTSFNYDQHLVAKLKESGATVDFFQIDISGTHFRLLKRLNLPGLDSYISNFYNKMLSKDNYDFVLVRYGHQLAENFLRRLRFLNPKARFINFHWDSITPLYNYLHIIPYFDKVFSFDIKDCETHAGINYLPLFYLDCYKDSSKNKFEKNTDFDLLFIGSWRNQERYNLIKQTEKLCRQNQLDFFYYLHFSLMTQIDTFRKKRIITKQAKRKVLTENEILNLFSRTNTIIDFPSSYQSGLTIRTFEALGSGKKLITTNKNIKKAPFFNHEYVSIIDANNIKLDIDFIKNKPTFSIEEELKDYTIGNYISNLLQQ